MDLHDINNILQNTEHLISVDSTNSYLKAKAEAGAPSFSCVVADYQTDGRGRMGRKFSSPDGHGLYMSLLLRPTDDLDGVFQNDVGLITACAAVAVREAIQTVCEKNTDIKWVNDLYYEGKKVCGILAEGVYSPELQSFEYIVLGIGINICGGFEGTELENTATSLYRDEDVGIPPIKDALISEILISFIGRYLEQVPNGGAEFFDTYKDALFIIGKDVRVLRGESAKDAKVIGLNRDFTLKVRYEDGCEESLNSGEVRLKIK